MIEIKNLTKRYGNVKAVEDISFTVEKGEVVGFLGPNGAGKSTTMNVITGYIPSTEGSVKVCGIDVFENPMEVKKRIGYLPETPPLYLDMTVMEYLKFVADLKKVKKSESLNSIESIMVDVGIDHVSERLIKNLSKGYKQRVGIAQALIGNPEVVILDEPTVGLDPKQIIEIRELINKLGKKHTVILSSHILSEVSAVCTRIVIINKGKIIAQDSTENLKLKFGQQDTVEVLIEGNKEQISSTINSIKGVISVYTETTNDSIINKFIIKTEKDADIRKEMFFALAKINTPILELKRGGKTLEDIYLDLTKEQFLGDSNNTENMSTKSQNQISEEDNKGVE